MKSSTAPKPSLGAPRERRYSSTSKFSPLPLDYLQMVEEVFTHHFDEALQAFNQIRAKSNFLASGAVFSDEVVLTVSLVSEGQLAATTLYASADFDPKASSPTVQDLLAACVDALGTAWSGLLDPRQPEALANLAKESLSALENAPFEWTSIDSNQRKVFVKIDESNPQMDEMAENWLKAHDPNYSETLAQEQSETEKLFVTGPSELKVQRSKKKS